MLGPGCESGLARLYYMPHRKGEAEKLAGFASKMFFVLSFIQYASSNSRLESFASGLLAIIVDQRDLSYGLLVSLLPIPPNSIGRTESNRNKAIVWSFCRGLTCVRHRIVRGSSGRLIIYWASVNYLVNKNARRMFTISEVLQDQKSWIR